MFKRILAIAAMVCMLPALANAQKGSIETWAKSAGGNIITSLNGSPLTSAYGKRFANYSTVAAPTVTVTANPGFNVGYETANTTGASGSYTLTGGASYVYATFTYGPQLANLQATAGPGGRVNIKQINNIYIGQTLLNPITFKFTPAAGYKVSDIKLNTVTVTGNAALTVNPLDGITSAKVGQTVSVTFPAGYKFLATATLAGTFDASAAAPTAKTGAPQTATMPVVATGGHGTPQLDGSGSLGSPTSFLWVQTAGPVTANLLTPTASKTYVTGLTTAGTYYFKLTVNGSSSATTSIIVTTSATVSAANQCANCHLANGVGTGIYSNWSTSIHSRSTTSICSGCHAGANTAAHPGTVTAASVNPQTFVIQTDGVNGGFMNDGVTPLPKGAIFCTYCHNGAYPIPHPTTGQTMTCVACHGGGTDAHTIQPATLPPVVAGLDGTKDCKACHSGEPTKFAASKHWNNSFEYSSITSSTVFDVFYNGVPTGSAPSLTASNALVSINPNESWNTYEWSKTAAPTAPVTCSTKCHFEAKQSGTPLAAVTGVTGCNACHSGGLQQGGVFKNGSSAHKTPALASNTCEYCHYSAAGTGHGLTTAEFTASAHWTNPNNFNYTQQHGTTKCAYACHFAPNLNPADATPGVDSQAGTLRPGLDACVACHDPHNPTTDSVSTCFNCHSGASHGATTTGYQASLHYTDPAFHPTQPDLYNSSAYTIIKSDCMACHNPHKPEQTTAFTSSLVTPTYNYTNLNPCAVCHNGIAAEGRKIGGKLPGSTAVVHFTNASTANIGGSNLSYVGAAGRPVNNCTECHFKVDPHSLAGFTNNTAMQVLPSWAGSLHGSISGPNAWNHYQFKANNSSSILTTSLKGASAATTTTSPCVRCHTAKGLVNFITASAGHPIFTMMTSVGDRTNMDASPLVCSGCHAPGATTIAGVDVPVTVTTSVVRTVPAMVGYYNVSSASSKKILTSHQYSDYGKSNICMACHAGYSGSGEAINKAFATTGGYTGNVLSTHHDAAGLTLGQYGLYEYGDYSKLKNAHATIGGSAAGPCVSCHYDGSNHSLKAVAVGTGACTGCHPDGDFVATAKANFNGAVAYVLLQIQARNLASADRTAVNWAVNFGPSCTPAKNMGASLNYITFAANEQGAYVHNPSYAKKVIFDTMDYLQHGTLTGDISDTNASPAIKQFLVGTHPDTTGQASCSICHASGAGSESSASSASAGCVVCHAAALNAGVNYVQDNSGVRAIIPEFQKTSHHIYNGPTALPVDAQCAVCHLEGKAVGGAVVVNNSVHMTDAKIHLRNAGTDADFAWDPMAAAPDQTGMDNFCFSCHNANGATSPGIVAIQAVIIAANPAGLATPATLINAGNPFGDLLTNKYDQVTRSRVVDVWAAMQPGNASHHAVVKPKYKTRSTTTAIANGDMVTGQSTLFDGGLFVSDYTPLGASTTVGDDSQLHCGDCHTVGQWKANTNATTNKYNSAAIGAHGSANEYMLRNNLGTDALHNGTTYVCFNCHNDKAGVNTTGGYYAGYTNKGVSPTTGHMNGIHAGTNGCLQNTAGNAGNAISATGRLGGNMFVNYTSKNQTLLSKGSAQGNITGIACTNCHNAGIKNATLGQGYSNANSGFGGIHGGNTAYSDSNGGAQAPARFMSGMGNFKYIPPANTFNTNTAAGQPSTTKGATVGAGLGSCYTNSLTTDNAGYSSCNHHGTGTTIQRVGGTVGNVTRPLSY